MQYGLNRLDLRSPAAFAASAARAEALGWDVGLTPVSPLLAHDPYVLLAAAAGATRTIRLGTLLENPVMRHPAVIAGSAATVASLAPGRTLVTLGVGDTAVRLAGRSPARVAELEHAAQTLRALLRGESVPVAAARPARLRHAPPERVPVWIAAGGPRTLAMAGAVADGVFLRVGTHPANLQAAIDAIHTGARQAGRDPESVSIAAIVHVCVTDDGERAGRVARCMAAGFHEYAPYLFERAGIAWNGPHPDTLKGEGRVWPDFHHATDVLAAGGEVAFLGDDAADAFSITGSWADIRARIAALAAAVPQAALLVPHPVPDHGNAAAAPRTYVEDFAREVILPARAGTIDTLSTR